MMNGVNGMGDSQTAQLLTQQGVMQSNLVQICKYQENIQRQKRDKVRI